MPHLVEQEPPSLQQRPGRLGKVLGWVALAACALVFVLRWARADEALARFLISVSLAVAAVAEGCSRWSPSPSPSAQRWSSGPTRAEGERRTE